MPNAEFIFPVVKNRRIGGAKIRSHLETGYHDLRKVANLAELGLQTVETLSEQIFQRDLEPSHTWAVSVVGATQNADLDGDSGQLAALLALFADSYPVVPELAHQSIWCTGCVSSRLEIKRVERETFNDKLSAFLEAHGRIFFVPRANCAEAEADIIAMGMALIRPNSIKGHSFSRNVGTVIEVPTGREGLVSVLEALFEDDAPVVLVRAWQREHRQLLQDEPQDNSGARSQGDSLADPERTPTFEGPLSAEQARTSILARLLPFVWHYPEQGGNYNSWSAKESSVLKGRLEDAREDPSLGIAIVTTELALSIFGKKASSRIERCVTWALGHCSLKDPFLLKGKRVYRSDSREVEVPDFRHSLAFAIILARSGKLNDRVSKYLDLTFKMQNADDGWPADEGETISEIFTVLYAIEFLSLCEVSASVPEEVKSSVRISRDRAARWLLSKISSNDLWQSGVLREYIWEDVSTTAWILHRLAPVCGITIPDWNACLSRASLSMISKLANPATWRGSSEIERFRIEARASASVSVVLATGLFDSSCTEALQIYLPAWQGRARTLAAKIPDADWDIGTAAFLLRAMFSNEEMREWSKRAELVGPE